MEKLKEILFLQNLKRVGKATIYGKYWKILNEYNDIDELFYKIEKSKEELNKAKNDAENLYDYIINSDITAITVFDEIYPRQLMCMGNKRPLVLYVRGNVGALTKPNIAVIGTRKPSDLSQEFEINFVKAILNDSDVAIVSGLALGCDKIAHKTTVDEHKTTIAFLPSGVNDIKPARHKKLAQDIIETGGCLVSEYNPNASAFKSTYVERDNIVAAFSDAIFVVECGIKSGTMHTVKFADGYQKQIYSYLPSNKPEGTYDGNEFILNEFSNTVKVDNIEDFLTDLKNLKAKKPSSIQKTLI